MVPGLSNSSSGSDSSTSKTLSRQGSHCSTSSSSSSSSHPVSDIQTREREDRTESDISPVHVSTTVDDRSGRPDIDQANKNRKKQTKRNPRGNRATPVFADSGRASSEIPEWLQEFRENLVDDEIPLKGGSHASSSHEASLEPTAKRREDLGKHSVYTHFPKDRKCEICKRTKITRAPCRGRNGEAVLRAENFGDLITADHKVLIENCESRNNHRRAVVVQDLATQWIQGNTREACKSSWSSLLSGGKTLYERRFGQPFKGPITPFGSLVEYHPITAKDQSRIHQFGKKVLPGLFLGYALYAG